MVAHAAVETLHYMHMIILIWQDHTGLLVNDCRHPQGLRIRSSSNGGFRMLCMQPYYHNLEESILLAYDNVIAMISDADGIGNR